MHSDKHLVALYVKSRANANDRSKCAVSRRACVCVCVLVYNEQYVAGAGAVAIMHRLATLCEVSLLVKLRHSDKHNTICNTLSNLFIALRSPNCDVVGGGPLADMCATRLCRTPGAACVPENITVVPILSARLASSSAPVFTKGGLRRNTVRNFRVVVVS